MNKLMALVGAASVAAVLASCGNVGSAPDGSGSLIVSGIKTDLKDQNNNYVACDNITYGYNNPPLDTTTNVATFFTLSGSISSAQVGLRGVSGNKYDNNYNASFTGDQLQKVGGINFKASFAANSAGRFPGDESGFLPQSIKPQSIVVNPINQNINVRLVSTNSANRLGSLYSMVTVNTTTSQTFSANSPTNSQIPVYSLCTFVAPTSETL